MTPQPSPSQVQEDQARAVFQFHDWYHDPLAVVVDTETTGTEGHVFDFAAVPLDGGSTPAPVLAFLCSPPEDAIWSSPARQMHTERLSLSGGWGIEAYSLVVLETLSFYNVLAYGARFDEARLRFTLNAADCVGEFPDFQGCVMTAYAPLAGQWSEKYGDWKWVPLDEACRLEHVDISDLPRHTAYGDAVATARLIRAVATRAEVN